MIRRRPALLTQQNQPANDAEWFGLQDCANVLAVTRQTFNETYRPLVPADAIRNAGKKGVEIHLRRLIDVIVEKRGKEMAEDPMLVGDGSPWLEEYRKQRTRLAQMDVEEREKTHVNLSAADEVTARMGQILVRAAEALQRRFGADAFQILDDAVGDWRSQWGAWRKTNEGGGKT